MRGLLPRLNIDQLANFVVSTFCITQKMQTLQSDDLSGIRHPGPRALDAATTAAPKGSHRAAQGCSHKSAPKGSH